MILQKKNKFKINQHISFYKKISIATRILVLVGFAACTGVKLTFSGVNLPPEVKTVSISTFFNETAQGPANIDILFTEDLKEYYQRNTPLDLIAADGDLQFAGAITSYATAPVAPGASTNNNGAIDQTSQLQRLTIRVSVEFINRFSQENSFAKQSFSYFSDFPADQNLSDVENELIDEIFEQIIFDIFNKTAADW